ncbi:GTP cyclohydrolase I [Roseomonas xinghualingensis]|uniref:GTP cyclohydrolase I n=1 Tax=Roseomonas xinghualingensis TaxID=2986475 RepID=UPI0021F15142|nr:GTP cyclohydrolase I [Roseomonas sp. SXEYE001]MCV4208726.1 GTP cyclohydrolase I [Roseomonas sp. SXEYE001]
MSVTLRRLQSRASPANEALDEPLSAGEREAMICAASEKLEELLDILRIDHRNDPNTRGTPVRVAKMFVNELMRGRAVAPPSLTDFENRLVYQGMIVTGPIEVRSTCAHHLMPIRGEAFIGVLPSATGKVLGLSKYDRVVDHFASRLQTQEELVQQIGEFLWQNTNPRGLAVRISAAHMCRMQRGVRAGNGRMVTSAYFGALSEEPALKDEFLRECVTLDGSSR